MNIGNFHIENKLMLAPMAGVTDLAFRIICKEMGVGLTVTEMVSVKGIYYKDKKTDSLTTIDPRERPVSLQIFGSEPDIMAHVARENLNDRKDIDLIDINMGCPAPKIVKNGDGSALMKDPKLAARLIKSVVDASNKPVTVKIRKGWDKDSINGVEIAKIAEDSGAAAVTVHARTRDMFYSGEADWDYIASVKCALKIPVIGNGDIFKAQDALLMMERTGCDGVAIGRGAMGNPWIFRQINQLLEGKNPDKPSPAEVLETSIRHMNMVCEFKGERIGVREMRKQLAWYIKGMKNSNEIKNRINTMEDKNEIESLLKEYLQNLIEDDNLQEAL
ncbi:tRNA dihydrouridine synthase DusB [Gudongella sp. DL1XJH-153]|uniref:tRNA dihydrouridine synthase DusB n=1 Tax=Gudongella sp. DL1XJH-153 TaxID=3409804 RepID=UPI003BB79035